VPYFLASYFLAERRSPKTILQLIVPVIMKQNLLLECKPPSDWFKVAVVQDNGAYILGVNPDPVLFPVDNALMESQLNNNSNHHVAGYTLHIHKPLSLEVKYVLLKN
jgi:hypothetical protein